MSVEIIKSMFGLDALLPLLIGFILGMEANDSLHGAHKEGIKVVW